MAARMILPFIDGQQAALVLFRILGHVYGVYWCIGLVFGLLIDELPLRVCVDPESCHCMAMVQRRTPLTRDARILFNFSSLSRRSIAL